MASLEPLPIIDFAAFADGTDEARRAIADQIGAACRRDGFFALKNHRLETATIEAGFAMAKAFFDLSEAEKSAIAIDRSACHRGWFGHGQEVLDKAKQPQGDAKEGLKIGRDLGPDHARVQAGLPLHGPNQWPTESGALIGFRARLQALYNASEVLSRQLMQAFALSLDLPHSYFDHWLDEPMATLAPLRYPPMRDPLDEAALSAGAHTDFGCLTLLFQHDEAGLEISTQDGGWQRVPMMRDAVVVNIGDMMARWTGGRYASTVHRVVNRTDRVRHSMAYFFDPDPDAELAALPGCTADGGAPLTALQHLLNKISDSFEYMD